MKRYDFVLLADVIDGNMNGDPDNDGMPRIDPETMQGIMSDVCVKRKIRDTVQARIEEYGGGYDIYVRKGVALNDLHQGAYDDTGVKSKEVNNGKKKVPEDEEGKTKIKDYMTSKYFDVRTFGAVMSTSVDAGQVWGPVQIHQSKSIDPVLPLSLGITRIARTKKDGDENGEGQVSDHGQMGKKHITSYGLYKITGNINPQLAMKTGFNEQDLEVFWNTLQWMFMYNASSNSGLATAHKLYVFEHESHLGNAQPYYTIRTIKPEKKVDIPRSFEDYEVHIEESQIPRGVTLIEKF